MRLSKDLITGGVAVASLLLNVLQFTMNRSDLSAKAAAEAKAAETVAKAAETEKSVREWQEAPHLSFDYWQFTGESRAICRFFNVTPGIVVNTTAFGGKLKLDAIKVFDAPPSRVVAEKLGTICGPRGASKNDAKNWQFLLTENPSQTAIAVTTVTYGDGHAENVNIAVGPGAGLLIPIGYASVVRGTPATYSWPTDITFRWTGRAGQELKRTEAVRRPDSGAFGYVMDPAAGELSLSAPPD